MMWPLVSILLVACGGGSSDPGPRKGSDTGTPPDGDALPRVFLNEFMASNASTLADESGAFPDWIEIYNDGDTPVDLSGWWLSDDATSPHEWAFPADTVLEPKGYLVVFADGDTDDGPLHASFALNAGGEDITLTASPALDAVRIDAIEGYLPQLEDQSTARHPDGGTWQPDSSPTPRAANE